MKEQLKYLVQLQQMDAEWGGIQSKITNIPEQIEVSRKALDTTKALLAEGRAALEASQKRKREKESDLETQEAQLSKARDRQSGIKTNKEYQAHLQEIETLTVDKGRVEDELLELMEELETYKKKEEALIAADKAAELNFESVKRDLEQEMKVLRGRLEVSAQGRGEVASKLKPNISEMYQSIKKACRDLAVVPIQEGTCGGCHMHLPPQKVAEAKAQVSIQTCSQCQRILFWPTTTESPTPVTGTGSP